ncbi:MAG: type II secretion system GspH family protein [Planctomycetaceae bacterium]|jgi:prepilin-type N-terminal cleavage/methylation domain-containing protein|nr:type II secretion system GspH family protein [Planctomycetaceae bacterium]
MKPAFTLIELLIVIALLAGIAMIVLPNLAGDKKEVAETIIQSEMAEIQRAFFRFKNDCTLKPEDYQTVAQYGVAVLLTKEIDNEFSFDPWENDRQRGWRGAYLIQEDTRSIDPVSIGQQENGNAKVPVICCPQNNPNFPADYYRILATKNKGEILAPNASDFTTEIHQLWLVYPYTDFTKLTTIKNEIETENKKYYRQLLENEVQFDPPQ